jgi:hypothetical protein
MRLYLDDDSVARALIVTLRKAGHVVQIPADIGLMGEADPVHFLHAIREQRLLLSSNHDDFEDLHELVVYSGGSHPGVLIVRKDDDHRRDMTVNQIVRAIGNLLASSIPLQDSLTVLNHWR